LLCLRLESTPAVDMIDGTAQAWMTAITHGLVWNEQRDRARFQAAFDTLLANCTRWPIPRELLNALPAPDQQPRLGHASGIPETREGRMRRLAEVLGKDFNPQAIEQGDLGMQR
jgi:hypothetical protein